MKHQKPQLFVSYDFQIIVNVVGFGDMKGYVSLQSDTHVKCAVLLHRTNRHLDIRKISLAIYKNNLKKVTISLHQLLLFAENLGN